VGVPMVVCRTPSVLETLQGEEEFIPVEYGDLPSACEALEKAVRLVRVPDDRRKEKNERVKAKHSIESMLGKIRELYGQWGIRTPRMPQNSHGVPREEHGEPGKLVGKGRVE